MNTKKISIFNNKGGVAKTTSVINIAYSLHKADKKVLVVDCDTQENCFDFFFLEKSEGIFPTRYENIMHTTYSAYKNFSDNETENFDYVLFDLPPILTDEVSEIINISDTAYVPMMLGRFEIKGLKNLTTKCGSKFGGVFITMYKKRDADLLEQIKIILGDKLMHSVIPFSDTVRDSQKYGMPIEEYFEQKGVPKIGTAWNVVRAYTELTNEIIGGVE